MTIDLPPTGPAGIEAKAWDVGATRYVWIMGSDHWRDWAHHVLPGARRREINAASVLLAQILDPMVEEYHIGGHSLGAAVASIVTYLLTNVGKLAYCFSFGGKRPLKGYNAGLYMTAYRHRGDVVPWLPPWRPKVKVRVFGELMWPWKAHGPDTYDTVRREHGLK